ncbi:anti-sigma B factor antagonist [Allocatelliglobosispora scoriae]|uniref:Anti-sigma factor antagonist n=1 Tax=Allocatelliglobosispora scoriae TaxID=643052 RepID=A0A841BJ91_9ACTN|nr:STAS domain-containing protein [Allocatelliglobosispora scoriae]MBB5866890.1 anti-sigma B factor antagonist [Allocatelliglobosispora scoriae]
MGLTIDVSQADPGPVRVAIAGDVDLATVPELSAALTAAVSGRPQAIVVDLGGVTFLDSSGIAALITGYQLAEEHGVGFAVTNPRERIRWVLDLAGVWPYLSGEEIEAGT